MSLWLTVGILAASLSVTDEAYESQDWRVLAAMAVALDALQSR